MTLLNVLPWRQRQPADCLAACTAMALTYLQVPFEYSALIALLDIRFYGTAFSNLRKLEILGLHVSLGEWAGVEMFEQYLNTGLPVLVNVNTSELPYWNQETSHVVVVIGLEDDDIVVHDPFFDENPKRVPLKEFMLAWDDQYQRYGVIALDQTE